MSSPTEKNNGRDERGRFGPGNQASKGRPNPHARKVTELRSALLEAVTVDDVREVLSALISEAKDGNVQAMREFFNRVLGQADAIDVIARMEQLEERLAAATAASEGEVR